LKQGVRKKKDTAVKKELQQKLEETPQSFGEENRGKGNTEEEWLELKNNLRETFEEMLAVETKVSTREWFDADCERERGVQMLVLKPHQSKT
jgi:hypothetical protein